MSSPLFEARALLKTAEEEFDRAQRRLSAARTRFIAAKVAAEATAKSLNMSLDELQAKAIENERLERAREREERF